ncbi:Growth hormone secretagogue receptor type 1 [Nymphon striatum]|nr:Growth hormone secretagogue receptor type 1 [Nymphon striatum]
MEDQWMPLLDLNTTQILWTNTNESNSTNCLNNSCQWDNVDNFGANEKFPFYLRLSVSVFCGVSLVLGVFGNVLVPLVVCTNRDMRNSTNIFLVNLSIADLLVILTCVPTAIIEVNARPETWVLGHVMCKIVPFVESTVCHGSVLTMLAISFERFYAICHPLKAAYTCTKTRAIMVILLLWLWSVLVTTPVITFTSYRFAKYIDDTTVPVCVTEVHTPSRITYFIVTTTLLFIVPFPILVVIYVRITKKLMSKRPSSSAVNSGGSIKNFDIGMTARRQVIAMLITVIICFFSCLLPIRIFYFWYILVPKEKLQRLGPHVYFNLLYLCRSLLYLNSAINPMLYNVISSKFRKGFKRQLFCECVQNKNGHGGVRERIVARKSTISMTTVSSTRSKCNS